MFNKSIFRIIKTLKPRINVRTYSALVESRNNALTEAELKESLPQAESKQENSVLDRNTEDLSHIAPYLKPTFNFAAYVNKSITLQELLKLGVNLHKVEKQKNALPYIIQLDFEENVKKHVTFLHDLGVEIDKVGEIITKNPFIFKEDLNDLQTRINYLECKKFTKQMILRIISVNPFWLSYSTQEIDENLGYFQNEFNLSGNEVRELTAKQPKLITYSRSALKSNIFTIKEEMGFNDDERKAILLNKPKMYMLAKSKLLGTFDYVHRELKFPLETIAQMPDLLTYRLFRVKQRHLFLKTVGKAQYNPKEPGYISLLTAVAAPEADFCVNIAKCTMETYNTFLKSL